MQKTTLPGLPARRAADYELDGFDPPRFARVVYSPQETKPAYTRVEAQAFEVDAVGRFCSAPNGAPSRTPGTNHQIDLSGIGSTHTLQPGWVFVVGNYDEGNLPEGTTIVESLPETAEENDRVWYANKLHRWSVGMLEEIMRAKAKELAGILRNSALMDFDL